MAMNLQIEGYTKTGFKVLLTQSVRDEQAARSAMSTIDRLGLLPNQPEKPDETEYGKISHVALTSKDDGTLHVAFYHQNSNMINRYTHLYMDTEADKEAFEQWSGLVLAELPQMADNNHPKRDKPTFKKYAVLLEKPMALIRSTTYTKTDEGYDPSHGVERYIGSMRPATKDTSASTAQDGLTLDTWKAGTSDAESVRAYLVEEGLTEEEALAAVPPTSWNSFPNAVVAMQVISEHINKAKPEPGNFGSIPGVGVDGFKKYQQRQQEKEADADFDDETADETKELELDDIPF